MSVTSTRSNPRLAALCDEALLLGSAAWQIRREREMAQEFKVYNPATELRGFYERYHQTQAAMGRINARITNPRLHTPTGYMYEPSYINALELHWALTMPHQPHRGLHGLEPRQRVAFELLVVNDTDEGEVARSMGLAVSSVRQYAKEALGTLRGLIYEPLDAPPPTFKPRQRQSVTALDTGRNYATRQNPC